MCKIVNAALTRAVQDVMETKTLDKEVDSAGRYTVYNQPPAIYVNYKDVCFSWRCSDCLASSASLHDTNPVYQNRTNEIMLRCT